MGDGWVPGSYRKRTFVTADRELVVIDCSISDLDYVDALVSSDDNYLSHGGGTSRVLWSAAGPELRSWVDENVGALRLGDVVRTPAFGLRAEHLFHAVTIDFDENRRVGPREAHALFSDVLDAASRIGCHTLGLPLLGTGGGRLSRGAAANALAQAWHERALHETSLHQVYVCALAEDFEKVSHVLNARLPNEPPFATLIEAAAASLTEASAHLLLENWRKMAGASSAEERDGFLLLLFEACVAAHEEVGGADAPESLRLAWHARNQLAHGMPAERDRGELHHQLLQTCEELLRRVRPGRMQVVSSGTQPVLSGVRSLVSPPWPATPPREERASLPASGPGGTRHVRKLAVFLLEALGDERLAELLARLEIEGYQGEPEMRVLEFCVNLPDPVDYLASEFSRGELRGHLRKRAGLELPVDSDALFCAQELLDFFGLS